MIIPLNYTEFKGINISSLEFCTKFWIQGKWRTAEYNLLLSHSVSCQLLSHFSFSWIFLMCLLSLSLLEIAFPRSSHLNHFSQSVLCQLLPFLILAVPIACPLSLSFAHAKSFSLPFSLSWMPISCGRPVRWFSPSPTQRFLCHLARLWLSLCRGKPCIFNWTVLGRHQWPLQSSSSSFSHCHPLLWLIFF